MATLASNAKLYGAVADALAARGFTVKKWAGWSTRTASKTASRIVTPTSVCIHHTAGNYTATTYIRDGDPGRGLPGPLTNWHITRDGVVHLLGVGYQNHAGLSYQPNYDRIAAGTAPLSGDMRPGADSRSFSANRYMMGVEVNGDGGADDFTPLQYRAAVALAAEYHRVRGWKVPRVGAHKELTRRKPGDPVANMGRFRSDVLAAIAAPWGPVPGDVPVLKLGDRLLSKNGNDSGADVSALIAALNAKGYKLTNDGLFGPAVDAAVRDLQTKAGLTVDGIVGPATVAALTAVPVPPEPTPEPEPTPVPPVDPVPVGVAVRVATLRLLGPEHQTGHPGQMDPLTDARRKALVKATRAAKADFYCLTECPKDTCDAIRAGLPGGAKRWKVWERGAQRIVFDSSRAKTVGSPLFAGWGYHGAAAATYVVDGKTVTVGAYHLPPDSTTDKGDQQNMLAAWLAQVAKMPGARIIGGDGMNSTSWAKGWTDARTAATTSSTRDKATYGKTAITDRILSLGPVAWRGYNVKDAGVGSDHDLVITAATLGGDLS